MKWLKTALLKFLRDLVSDLIKRSLELAVIELEAEIDDSFENKEQRDALKTGIKMLHSKVLAEIQEKLERL